MMFREMRRSRQRLSGEDTVAVMKRTTGGVLACHGEGGYPYAVPLNFVYTDGTIYFHSAKDGHKIEAIGADPKVSFAVVDEDTIVSAEYTSYFRSVIAFGKARIADGDERLKAFRALVEKYSGDQPEEVKSKEVSECTQALIVAIDVEHIAGKEAREYAQKKNSQIEGANADLS
jgi:nitroimidazol reductase NimA-like FMN-containing flavoprotein (pyridoxamine 5'-phosphate oxidase superfamily)